MRKSRFIVLTDISHGFEEDDIESMVRLMLYTNEIDIEGLIATTSCWYKDIAKEENVRIILDIIDAYSRVKSNLDIHAQGYPEPDFLRSVTARGIDTYGYAPGRGWGEERYNDNPGVKLIIDAADREDDRPLWIGLWGGANTLAHAVWKVSETRTEEELNGFLSKLRIYGISDQDWGGHWLRENFGDRLFYIISPSPGDKEGGNYYCRATWPGISGDDFMHGSNDGREGGGFNGAERELISREWLQENIISHGPLGAEYPIYNWLMEGDSPTYLYLVPNGLGSPDNPSYGSWGGRYAYYIPNEEYTATKETYPVWTNSSDEVKGEDGKIYCSPQASIWRWRDAFQNDFAARMIWSETKEYKEANHPPVARLAHGNELHAVGGETITLSATGSCDPDGDAISFRWIYYREAGTYDGDIRIEDDKAESIEIRIPDVEKATDLHFVLCVTDSGQPPLTRYQRVIIHIHQP